MIVKLKSFKKPRFKELLEYMLKDENRLYNKDNKSFLITYNLKGRTIEKLVNQFVKNETFRKRKRKDSVILTHEIISFHKDDTDHITLEKLQEISREYINKRNLKGLYVAVPHFDKEHYHIHICASGIEFHTGKSLRMSKEKFQKLKKDIQQFQLEHYPELSKSLVSHDKKSPARLTEKEYQEKLRTGRATTKETLIKLLGHCLDFSHGKEEFFQRLQESGLETYQRSGITTGVVYANMKFRFTRLGFSKEHLAGLGISAKRGKDLNGVRNKKGKTINHHR